MVTGNESARTLAGTFSKITLTIPETKYVEEYE